MRGWPLSPPLRFLVRYFAFMLAGNLAWETLQLPLYTIWTTATAYRIADAVVHCTGGDLLIAMTALGLGWLAAGRPALRERLPRRLILATIVVGATITAFSEWWNTQVIHSWAYSALMPIVPGTALGLSPLLQWIVLPLAGLLLCFRRLAGASTIR